VRWQRRSAMVWVAGVERERPGLGWWFITEVSCRVCQCDAVVS
jgi:hypothetical protein